MTSRSRFAGLVALTLGVGIAGAALWWRGRRRDDGCTGWPGRDLEGVILPSARALGDDYLDCGCPDLYYCPAAGEVECPRHGGFATCCARPADHIHLRTAAQREHIVDAAPERDGA